MTSIETKGLPVLLTIRSEQHFEDMEPDSIELMTEGTLTSTGEGELAELFAPCGGREVQR